MRGPERIKPEALPVPTESVEQQYFFRWAWTEGALRWRDEINLLYHVPNEGKRSRATGARMRAESLRAGAPDINLDVARGGYHGLRIELKRRRGGRVSPEQEEWLEALRRQGYAATVARGWEEAAEAVRKYLEGAWQ